MQCKLLLLQLPLLLLLLLVVSHVASRLVVYVSLCFSFFIYSCLWPYKAFVAIAHTLTHTQTHTHTQRNLQLKYVKGLHSVILVCSFFLLNKHSHLHSNTHTLTRALTHSHTHALTHPLTLNQTRIRPTVGKGGKREGDTSGYDEQSRTCCCYRLIKQHFYSTLWH